MKIGRERISYRLSQSVNEGVCRTGPATTGLLNIHDYRNTDKVGWEMYNDFMDFGELKNNKSNITNLTSKNDLNGQKSPNSLQFVF